MPSISTLLSAAQIACDRSDSLEMRLKQAMKANEPKESLQSIRAKLTKANRQVDVFFSAWQLAAHQVLLEKAVA